MPRSPTPARSPCLAMRTSHQGESPLPTAFACDLAVAAGASFLALSLSRRLAARRCCPRSCERRGLQRQVTFRGSITRPQRSLSTLRSPPRDGPRKTRLQPVANLCCAGLATRRATFEVSAFHASSSAKLSWRNHICYSNERSETGFEVTNVTSSLVQHEGRCDLSTES